MPVETGITLYRRPRNGPGEASVTIALMILDLQFEVRFVDISKKDHLQDWYRKINPNSLDCDGSIPVITDTLPNGEIVTLFETGTILEYLADRYDSESRIKPRDCLKSDLMIMSWLYWSLGQFAPMLEEVLRYHIATENQTESSGNMREESEEQIPRDQQVADYLANQSRRHFRILDNLLKSHGCMLGDRPTIADIACFPWASVPSKMKAGISLQDFPNVQRWVENMFIWAGRKMGTTAGQLDAICDAYSGLRIT
ncbi:hypothetical protein E4U17_005767 [Claviceps sp. LM77 group G4]|nr:hypothetical protein E4U17_005767 [Claviceps sp. LM77 group G4]KAG6079670.1 hypothetical protein E4U33_000112 [Claviceps sp. LM78 group G4]KAG6084256.1 hypothetical protein E4U16_002293 [Claviceps sp. LM84 group G4]